MGQKLATISVIILLAISQQACKTFRLNVRPGHVLAQSKIDPLKPNQSKEQVIEILGDPNLTPIYPDRLDYFYSLNPNQDKVTKQNRLSLFFTKGKLESFDGDITPKNLSSRKKN